MSWSQDGAGEEDAARPRVYVVGLLGKLREVERPACDSTTDRRVMKLRPNRVTVVPQA